MSVKNLYFNKQKNMKNINLSGGKIKLGELVNNKSYFFS